MDKKTMAHFFFNMGGRETSRDLVPLGRLWKQIVSIQSQ